MKNKIIIFLALFFVLIPAIVNVTSCLAAIDDEEYIKVEPKKDDSAGTVKLDNPLGGGDIETAQDLIGQIVNAILGVVGSLALLMFVYGGLTWMTAAGNEEKIKKGKGILMWATIGLVVIFTSYAVLNFVIGVLGGT